jgi:predicted transposase/invertase (TIGR01784 family)
MRYLDPKNDLTFRKVFGQHPHLLKSFLNALLPLDIPIKTLEYLPADLVPDIPLLKFSIVDVRCVDENGRQFIVEMQMLWTDSFKSRVLFNASKAYVKQLDKGGEYKQLQPVYALSLVNEIFEPEVPDFYHHYKIVHLAHNNKVLKGLEFVFVEIPKFKASKFTEKRLQALWLRYLSETESNDSAGISPDLLEITEIREAIELLQESGYTKTELAAYDKYWDSVSVERSLLSDSYIEGMKEGESKGKMEGKMEGVAQMVLNGYKAGATIEFLAEMAQISPEKVRQILGVHQ